MNGSVERSHAQKLASSMAEWKSVRVCECALSLLPSSPAIMLMLALTRYEDNNN